MQTLYRAWHLDKSVNIVYTLFITKEKNMIPIRFIVHLTSRGQIFLPQKIQESLKLIRSVDYVEFSVENDKIFFNVAEQETKSARKQWQSVHPGQDIGKVNQKLREMYPGTDPKKAATAKKKKNN